MGTICFIWTNRSKISLPYVINIKCINETASTFSVTLGLELQWVCTWSTSQSEWAIFPAFNSHVWWVATTKHRSTEQGWQSCKSRPKSLNKKSMTYVSEEKENEGSKTILHYHWRTNCRLPRYILYYSLVKTIKTVILKLLRSLF